MTSRIRQHILSQGLCRVCRVRKLATKNHCRQCADVENAQSRARKARLVATGKCITCEDPLATRIYCRPCADTHSERTRSARKAKVGR
jgi:hypothetical protein